MIVYQQRLLGSGGLSCNIKVHTNFKDPRIKTLGFFVFSKGKMEKIDYEKLNERIVEQAYEAALSNTLTKEQLQKLIQDKFERARIYQESMRKSPTYSIN